MKINSNPPELGYYFVKFIGPVKQEWMNDVERAGATIYGNADKYAILVGMNAETLTEVENLDSVMWTGIFQPAYKVYQKLNGVSGDVPVKIYTFPERQGKVAAEMSKTFARHNGKGRFFDDYSVPTHILDGEIAIRTGAGMDVQIYFHATVPCYLFVSPIMYQSSGGSCEVSTTRWIISRTGYFFFKSPRLTASNFFLLLR